MDMPGESREAEQQYLDRLKRQSGHVRREQESGAAYLERLKRQSGHVRREQGS